MKGLMERTGETRGNHAMDPYLYEPRGDLMELILKAMPDYRALSSEEEPSTTGISPGQSQITDLDEDPVEDSEDALAEADQELVGASTERHILRPSQGEQLSVTPGVRTCSALDCSNDISHLRAGAQTCSGRCRKALSRSRRKILEPQGSAQG
jgi:hypothetical protein